RPPPVEHRYQRDTKHPDRTLEGGRALRLIAASLEPADQRGETKQHHNTGPPPVGDSQHRDADQPYPANHAAPFDAEEPTPRARLRYSRWWPGWASGDRSRRGRERGRRRLGQRAWAKRTAAGDTKGC